MMGSRTRRPISTVTFRFDMLFFLVDCVALMRGPFSGRLRICVRQRFREDEEPSIEEKITKLAFSVRQIALFSSTSVEGYNCHETGPRHISEGAQDSPRRTHHGEEATGRSAR